MTERVRDILVGLFVLLGLVALGAMVVAFGRSPEWLTGKRYYEVRVNFEQLSDVQEGTPVVMRGVTIGRVKDVQFTDLQRPQKGTWVVVQVERQYRIPVSARARVRPALIGFGRSDMILEVDTDAREEYVPTDGTAELYGDVGSPIDSVIPKSMLLTLETTASRIGDLAAKLTPVADDLHQILKVRPIEEVETPPVAGQPRLSPNMYTAVERLYRVLTHFDTVLGDPETQSNVKVAVANLRQVSEEAKAAAQDIRKFAAQGDVIGRKIEATLDTTREQLDSVGRKLAHNADQLSTVLDHVGIATKDMAEGEGTMGKLLRDPKLYDEMVMTVRQLQAAIRDLQALIQKLQDKGLFAKG